MVDNVEGLGQALETLSAESLPELPRRLEAVLQEAIQTRAAAEAFLASVDARLAEAGELIPRVEASLRALGRVSAGEAVALDQDRTVIEALGTDIHSASLEEQLPHLLARWVEAQGNQARTALHEWEVARDERGQAHQGAFAGTRARFAGGQERLTLSSGMAAQGVQALQHMVEVTRGALTEEVERFGAVLESQQAATVRDVDELRKDLEGFEAAVITRVDRMREAVRQDTEEMVETTRDRMEELRQLAERAVKQLANALEDLDGKLKQAEDDAEDTRESLVSQFDDLQERLAPLRHALEGVREAAHSVGIPL